MLSLGEEWLKLTKYLEIREGRERAEGGREVSFSLGEQGRFHLRGGRTTMKENDEGTRRRILQNFVNARLAVAGREGERPQSKMGTGGEGRKFSGVKWCL